MFRIGDDDIDLDAESMSNLDLRALRDVLKQPSVIRLIEAMDAADRQLARDDDMEGIERLVAVDEALRPFALDFFDLLAGVVWIARRKKNPELKFGETEFTMADMAAATEVNPEKPVGKGGRTGTSRNKSPGTRRSRTTSG